LICYPNNIPLTLEIQSEYSVYVPANPNNSDYSALYPQIESKYCGYRCNVSMAAGIAGTAVGTALANQTRHFAFVKYPVCRYAGTRRLEPLGTSAGI
jgi:hypothetical protein